MNKKRADVPKDNGIFPEEYDFSAVAEDDLERCCFYEYARESKTIISEVERIRTEMLASKKGGRLPAWRCGETWSEPDLPEDILHLIGILSGCEGFPTTPWQLLGDKDRHKFSFFPREAESSRFQDQLENINLRLLLNAYRDRVLCLSAKPEKAHLVNDLRQFLNEHFPEYKPIDGRGQGKVRSSLNELGAMRLRHYCQSLPKAQDLVAHLRNKVNGMSYGDRTAWDRACQRAKSKLSELLHVEDSPIRHTDGWRK